MTLNCLCFWFTERKVAFSAGLGNNVGYMGPFIGDTRVVFGDVMSNIGQAYNSSSGSDPSHLLFINVHSTGSITGSFQGLPVITNDCPCGL